MTETAVWVYAVTRPQPQIPAITGVSGEPVRVVGGGRLVAAVGSVSREEYGEQALRRSLEDLDWLDCRARLHHQVIASLAGSGPVVPMRLAILYDSDDRVEQMLAETQPEMENALAAVSGRAEWGVKLFAADHDVADQQSGPEPEPQTQNQKLGTAYLQRKRADLMAREEARRSLTATAETVYEAARSHAVAARRHALQDPQLSGQSRQMLLNAAYLVENDRSEEFTAAIASLGDALDQVDLQLTGPWPPYSFTLTAGSP